MDAVVISFHPISLKIEYILKVKEIITLYYQFVESQLVLAQFSFDPLKALRGECPQCGSPI
jgi:hypothetical protein